MGLGDRFRAFFQEIGLEVGPIEHRVVAAGSAGAHATLIDSDQKIAQAIDDTEAFHTLLNRVILKLLGYDGLYVDRSTLGWAERHIDKPMRGRSQ